MKIHTWSTRERERERERGETKDKNTNKQSGMNKMREYFFMFIHIEI
jgi:hypothetical protein